MDHITDENDLGLLNELGEEARHDAPVFRAMAALAGGGLLGTALLFRALGPLSRRISHRTGIPHARIRRTLTLLAPLALGLAGRQVSRGRRAGAHRKK